MTDETDEKPKKKRKRRQDPFIALHFRAMEDAAKAARAAGVHEDVTLAGLPRMWQHCWRKKTDRVHVNELDSFFTIVGPDQAHRLRHALAKNGFLEIDDQPDGDRVKGAAELLRIADSRSRGGHAAKGNLLRGPAKCPAPAGQVPGSCSGSSPALSATSHQPPANKTPPYPPLREGGLDQEKRSPRRRRDREPPPADPPPRVGLGWTEGTPQGEEWRRRLNVMRDGGAAYAVHHFERLVPIGFRPTPGGTTALVVRANDPFFADWCTENYPELLSKACVIVEKPGAPPDLRVIGGGAA